MPGATHLVCIKSGVRPTKPVKGSAAQVSDTVEADTVGLDATGKADKEAVATTAAADNTPAEDMDASKEEKMLRRTERWLERLAERDQKQREKEKLREEARMEQWARKWCSRTKVEVQPRGGA